MHDLPFWFLLVSLFLPRLSLFVGWYSNWIFPMPQPVAGVLWFFLPRILVIFTIYTVSGYCIWLWVHIGVAAAVYLFGGGSAVHRDNG